MVLLGEVSHNEDYSILVLHFGSLFGKLARMDQRSGFTAGLFWGLTVCSACFCKNKAYFFFRPNSGSLSQKNHAQGRLGTGLAPIKDNAGSSELWISQLPHAIWDSGLLA